MQHTMDRRTDDTVERPAPNCMNPGIGATDREVYMAKYNKCEAHHHERF